MCFLSLLIDLRFMMRVIVDLRLEDHSSTLSPGALLRQSLYEACIKSFPKEDFSMVRTVFKTIWGDAQVEERPLDDDSYREEVINAFNQRNLVPEEAQVDRVCTFLRQMEQNKAVLLLGQTFIGKSTLLQVSWGLEKGFFTSSQRSASEIPAHGSIHARIIVEGVHLRERGSQSAERIYRF